MGPSSRQGRLPPALQRSRGAAPLFSREGQRERPPTPPTRAPPSTRAPWATRSLNAICFVVATSEQEDLSGLSDAPPSSLPACATDTTSADAAASTDTSADTAAAAAVASTTASTAASSSLASATAAAAAATDAAGSQGRPLLDALLLALRRCDEPLRLLPFGFRSSSSGRGAAPLPPETSPVPDFSPALMRVLQLLGFLLSEQVPTPRSLPPPSRS